MANSWRTRSGKACTLNTKVGERSGPPWSTIGGGPFNLKPCLAPKVPSVASRGVRAAGRAPPSPARVPYGAGPPRRVRAPVLLQVWL